MKALITIPHYYKPKPDSIHGSHTMTPQQRAAMLEKTIYGFIDLFETGGGLIDRRRGTSLLPVNTTTPMQFQFVVCVHGEDHLVELLNPTLRRRVHLVTVDAEPKMLGFGCHQVLARELGHYDWYGFVEDDLGLYDRAFFDKLQAFNALGDDVLLLPNRFEALPHRPNAKIYTDGPAELRSSNHELMALFSVERERTLDYFGRPVRLRKTTNPHAGCFFLTERQMRVFANSPAFQERSVAYVSPLESSATLSVLRTFDVYKPARENADFLEMQHLGGVEMDKLNIVIAD